jgi:hypothetical protein
MSGKVFHFSRIIVAAKVLNQNIFRALIRYGIFTNLSHNLNIARGDSADRLRAEIQALLQ